MFRHCTSDADLSKQLKVVKHFFLQCQRGDKAHFQTQVLSFWFFLNHICVMFYTADQTVKSCYSFEWHVSKLQMASSIKRTSIKTAGDSLWEWHFDCGFDSTHLSLPARLKQHLRIQYSDRWCLWTSHHMISMRANSFPPMARTFFFSEAKLCVISFVLTYNTPKHKTNTNQFNKEISTNLVFNS